MVRAASSCAALRYILKDPDLILRLFWFFQHMRDAYIMSYCLMTRLVTGTRYVQDFFHLYVVPASWLMTMADW